MNSAISEDKSQSHTSDSEYQERLEKIRNFKYPSMPNRNNSLINQSQKKINIATNLFQLEFENLNYNLTLFSIEVTPQFDESNFNLRLTIYNYIEKNFPKFFKKNFFGGNVLFSLIHCENKEDKISYNKIEFNETIKEKKYLITLTKIEEVQFKNVNDFSGYNQKIKHYVETLVRNIILKNKNVIYFKDRTLFEINIDNITKVTYDSDERIYRGYMTSANITENGLCLLINNINKVISGKTVLQKMQEIKEKNKHLTPKEIQNEIKSYFDNHRTVITSYGVPRAYRIDTIDFDLDPKTLSITINDKEQNDKKITVTLYDYYKKKYKKEIKIELKQPLILAKGKKKKINEDSKKNDDSENIESKIYLIPQFLFITGNEDDSNNYDKKRRERNLKDKTRMDPNKKMKLIKDFSNLYNSDKNKTIKKGNQEYPLKSPKELAKEWGIKLGNNLSFQANILSPPKLIFLDKNKKDVEISINNGTFRPGIPFRKIDITDKNLFVIYDNNDKNIQNMTIQNIIKKLCEKFLQKGFDNLDYKKVQGFALHNTNKWETIEFELRKLTFDGLFGIIFCSDNLENNYGKLKEYFLKNCNIPTQHILTRNLVDKKGNLNNPLLFSVVDQINVKKGGMNYYIDFKKENLFRQNDDNKFLIIGLDSKYCKDQITYSMTSSYHPKLNLFHTQEKTVNKKVKQQKINALKTMFETAIKKLQIIPDYIIMYRQGGNEYHNKCLAVDELDIFKNVLKEKNKQNTFLNTKFYYICCNLKPDLKFFEEEEKNSSDINCNYRNPYSGLIIDRCVTQSNKFEFYLQPQFVSQGTATPSHYQVMYYDIENNNLDMEKLEKLTYYLTYYYWTWHGAIRIPAILKFSTTALDFYLKCLNSNYQVSEYNFEKPYYI